ncbi:hypothetical protein SKAU_G00355190 [Synaphobranchus kaupii]|uniref:Retinol dehydrogenase 11 n=1 Tax=Synaphobranchus kaupii TaxID=118154 RepID=A0A9Q1EH63_SYNKA|nr:hypothetical protein SKAU_G00355190 [Synaphobranchus kaupii]
MEWLWTDIFWHPLWAFSTLILAFVLRSQRRGPWDPRACPVELKGKTAIVTGANTGIGKFVALDFRAAGGNQDVHLRPLDTSSLASVRAFTEGVLREEEQLHILVNNAGASGLSRQITPDGLEVSFATNHLGPFLLTSLLLDLLKRSAPARIVNVASVSHWKGVVDFSHYRGENLTDKIYKMYCHTKLHNVICTNELARRLQGTGVTANSLHPGVVMTEVMRHYGRLVRFLFFLVGIFFFKSAEEGAVSTIYCAVSEEVEGVTGKYFDSDCALVLPAPLARDPALAVKDFELCERLTAKL